MSGRSIKNNRKDRQEAATGTILEYILWRGDLSFDRVPPGGVDALIFSTLCYVDFQDIVSPDAGESVLLRDAVQKLLEQEDFEERCFWKRNRELLQWAAASERFCDVGVCSYQTVFLPEEETQFAAITFLLPDGTACLAFRGTDLSIVGWKEDFNMAFQDSVPAQRLAQLYVQQLAAARDGNLRLCGHSKGGNLAVFSAAKSEAELQARILDIYNHDGPGFTEAMLQDPGYLAIVPKIHTYVPQSSVVGMLLDQKGEYTIVKSRQIGLLQHDPFSWQVLGGAFVMVEELTADSKFLDKTLQLFLADMSKEERNEFVDAIFGAVMKEENSTLLDILKPRNVKHYYTFLADEEKRKMLSSMLQKLVEVARTVHLEEPAEPEE